MVTLSAEEYQKCRERNGIYWCAACGKYNTEHCEMFLLMRHRHTEREEDPGREFARVLLRAGAQHRGLKTWRCPSCGHFVSLRDSQCPYCDKAVIENSRQLAALVTDKIIHQQVENPFPPQEYDSFRGFRDCEGFVGCWKKRDALKVARELRKDGFNVTVRGRGKRPKRFRKRFRQSLPLKYASHASVYVKNVKPIEVDSEEESEHNRRLRDGQVQGLLKHL